MELNSKNLLKQKLVSIFLKRNTTPPYLQIIQTCVEVITYVTITLGYPFAMDLFSPSTSEIAIALTLKGLLLLRKFKGFSAIKFVYVVFLAYILTVMNFSVKVILLLILLAILIIVDVLSNISFNFYSNNISSEQLNICKILHYVAIIFGITHSILIKNIASDAACVSLFVILWLVKKNSLCRSKTYKSFMLRIYMWIVAVHIISLLSIWMAIPLLARIIVPIFISQIIMQLYFKAKVPNFQELYSQQDYVTLAFEMMIYIHGEQYDQQLEQQIHSFLNNKQSSLLHGQDKNKAAYQKIIKILSNNQSYQQSLVLSQIYIFNRHQLLKSKFILMKMNKKVGYWDWIRKICLYRVEQSIRQVYQQRNRQIQFQNYDDYYKCDQFRSLLLKSSIALISLWEYLKRPEILTERFRQLSDKAVKMQRKLKKYYQSIKTKCLSISLLYISYLLQVARDSTLANSIVQTLAFNQDFQVNLHLDEKVFVQISLQEEIMQFQRVGHNISSLLGYQKKEIQGQKHEILLPQFYRKAHSLYIQDYLENSMAGLYLYKKKSIARNKWGYYQQCDIVLRLHFDNDGRLVLRGYLQISPNHHYNWNNFLFINTKQQVIECSQNLSDYAPRLGRLHKAMQIFKQVNLSKTLIQLLPSNNNHQYHPLLVFKLQDTQVVYYVKANLQSIVETDEKTVKYFQNMQILKFQWSFIKTYYLKLQQVSSFFSQYYIILFLLSIILIIGVIACQHLIIWQALTDAELGRATFKTTKNILYYYNNSIALGMKMTYEDMHLSYGYSNNFQQIDSIDLALDLQRINDELKVFTNNKYDLSSTIPGLTYSKANFDMVIELLSNAYIVKQFQDDGFLQQQALIRARISINSIFGASLTEYQEHFIKQLNRTDQSNNNFVLLAIICLILISFCIVIAALQYKLRQDEFKSLNILLIVPNANQLINQIQIFISKITRQQKSLMKTYNYENQRDSLLYNTSFMPDSTSKDITRSEVSIRQISGRDLLGDSFNRSGILQITQAAQKQQAFSYSNRQIHVSPSKIWILLAAIFISLAILSCTLGNLIGYELNGKINKKTSSNNIFRLFETGTFFSRSMVQFLNLLTSLPESGKINTTSFNNFIANYTQQRPLIVFTESGFPQFESFSKELQQMQYQYMCSYISCDPLYAKDINIAYTSTIQKIIAAAQGWTSKISAVNQSSMGVLVKDGELSALIHLIYYTEHVIRIQLLSLADLYFSGFSKYSDGLLFKKKILMGVGLGLTMIGLLLLGAFIWYTAYQKGLLFDVANLIKTDSYFNDNNRISDKDGAKINE